MCGQTHFLYNDIIYWSRLRHARTSGVYAGLTVLLNAEIEDYNVTSSSISGFKV